jgi:hypothetical protein
MCRKTCIFMRNSERKKRSRIKKVKQLRQKLMSVIRQFQRKKSLCRQEFPSSFFVSEVNEGKNNRDKDKETSIKEIKKHVLFSKSRQ